MLHCAENGRYWCGDNRCIAPKENELRISSGGEEQLEPALDGVEKLVFDFAELKYISSAGLRVLLTAMQVMEEQGEMIVKNVTSEVMEIFEVTGFIDDLNIE